MSVSVCMATYNGEAYITEQLASILNQLKYDDEIIISDDCSNDQTRVIIKSFKDDRITLIENKHQCGVIRNFEKALQASRGDYIFLCDQDDVWMENKVEVFLQYLQKYDLVQSDAVIVDSNLRTLHSSFFKLMGSKKGLLRNIFKNNYIGCNMAFKRKVLVTALPFPVHIPMHDLWLGIVGELFFKTFYIPQQLLYYRRHNTNVSQTGAKSPFSFRQQVNFRINIIRYFPMLFKKKFLYNRNE